MYGGLILWDQTPNLHKACRTFSMHDFFFRMLNQPSYNSFIWNHYVYMSKEKWVTSFSDYFVFDEK